MGMRRQIELCIGRYVVGQLCKAKETDLFRARALEGWEPPEGASVGDVQQLIDETTNRIVAAVRRECGVSVDFQPTER